MGHPTYTLASVISPKGPSTLLQTTASSTASCPLCWNWNKLRWMHSWAHGCNILNQRQVSSLSRILLEPRLCNRCIPLLGVAPRSSDYYLHWVASSTVQPESQPGWTAYPIICALRDLLQMGLASTAVEATAKSTKGMHRSKGNYLSRQFFFSLLI